MPDMWAGQSEETTTANGTILWIERPEEIMTLARRSIELGGHFSTEILCSGVVGLLCERDGTVLALKLCTYGPEVLAAIDDVVCTAAVKLGLMETCP